MKLSSNEIKQNIRMWVQNGGELNSPFGRIKIGKSLGEGGTSLVYAVDFASGAAIKFLSESVGKEKSTRYKRFLGEYVNLLTLIPTGAVVPLYHFDVQQIDTELTVPYLIMERCNQTLADYFKTNKLREAREFHDLLVRLLDILEIIHRVNIVHRDIKPQNILQRPNGDWVLADFGIAWFDPQYYEKDFKTKASDRMANFEFSAPEQRKRSTYNRPEPNMDLFALGQTLYYGVTGETVRGANHTPMRVVSPELAKYDQLITFLVQQDPKKRPQTVSDVRDFLITLENQKRINSDLQRTEMSWNQAHEFDERLRRVIPGKTGYISIKDKQKINDVMNSIGENCDSYELWWTQGRNNYYAHPIKQIEKNVWLIGGWECEIVELWIYREPNPQRQYVVLHLAARPPFGIYEPRPGRIREEAGFFNGKYITREEFDDGYAEIDGSIVKLMNAEVRMRHLREEFFFLAPHFSTLIAGENAEKTVHSVYQALLKNGSIKPEILKPLEYIKRSFWMTWLD